MSGSQNHYTRPRPATQLSLDLGIHYAPAIVRNHGLRDAHIQPLVAKRKGNRSGFMRGTLGAIRALSYGPETVGPPLFSIATYRLWLSPYMVSDPSSRYQFPTWPSSGAAMDIAMQAGFSRGLFTGANPHGPHRCGGWRGSQNTIVKCFKLIPDMRAFSPTTH